MKKAVTFLALILFSANAYATDTSKVELRGQINDGTTNLQDSGIISKSFTAGVRQSQAVTATASAFTAFTVPSGAKAILIDVGTVQGLKIKGVTGDTGISLDSTVPVLLPLSSDSSNVTLGVLNEYGTDATLRVYYY